jgi:hypothetical protein
MMLLPPRSSPPSIACARALRRVRRCRRIVAGNEGGRVY